MPWKDVDNLRTNSFLVAFILGLHIGEAIDVVSRFSGHQHKTNAAGGHLYLLLNGLFTESVPKDKGFVLEAKLSSLEAYIR